MVLGRQTFPVWSGLHTNLIFILFFVIRATTLPLPHVLSLHTTWTPSTIRRVQREVNVLLRVETDNV